MSMRLLIRQINQLIKSNKVERSVFSSVHARITDRIFNDGRAENSQIGTYSNEYIKRRVKNNWGSSRKVILQFTGQMKNDFSLIKDGNDWGSGFKNDKNGDKSRWVEDTYDKDIFTANREEQKLAEKLYATELKRFIE